MSKTQNAISLRRLNELIAILLVAMVFGITAYRALTTGITDDEASSYILYAKNLNLMDFKQLYVLYNTAIANHQWLNTILMHIGDQLTGGSAYSVASLRIPVLVTFAIYLLLVLGAYRNEMVSLTGFVALTTCYYMNEFFGLARGYGYSAMFVMLALFLYERFRKSHYSNGRLAIGILVALLFAGLANTVTLLIFPAIGIVLFLRMIQGKTLLPLLRRHYLGVVIFILGSVFLVTYHLGASQRDTGLYTGKDGYIRSTVRTFFLMYIGSERSDNLPVEILMAALALSCVLAVVLILKKNRRIAIKEMTSSMDFTGMLIIFVLISILMGPVFGKGYITGRTAIPFIPLVIIGFDELLRKRVLVPVVQGLTTLAFITLFCMQINVHQTSEWTWDYGQEQHVLEVLEQNENVWPKSEPIQDYSTAFYIEKYTNKPWNQQD